MLPPLPIWTKYLQKTYGIYIPYVKSLLLKKLSRPLKLKAKEKTKNENIK